VSSRLHRAHDDFASVDADANLDPRAALYPKLLATATKFVPRRDGRVQRPLRMVLMCDWRSEQREDAVAGRLDDVAVIPMDRVDHQLQCGINDGAGLFEIELLHQLGRALDVGEQRRHGFAFALETFRGGCIGYPNRSIVRFLGGKWRPKRSSTFTTEVLAGLIRRPAFRAQVRKWRGRYRQFMPDGMIGLFEGKYFWKMPADVEMNIGPTRAFCATGGFCPRDRKVRRTDASSGLA